MKIPIDIEVLEHLVGCIELQRDIHLLPKNNQMIAQDIISDTVAWGKYLFNRQKSFSEKLQRIISVNIEDKKTDSVKKVKAKVYCLDPTLYKDRIINGYLQPNGELVICSTIYKKDEFRVITEE